jgi:hypothetical protein
MSAAAARVAFLAAAAGLAGCSAFDPYPTYPQPAAAGIKDAGTRVAICYDAVVSSRVEVQKAAQDECLPNTRAMRVDTDWKLDYCPLLLPARATFVCAPKK